MAWRAALAAYTGCILLSYVGSELGSVHTVNLTTNCFTIYLICGHRMLQGTANCVPSSHFTYSLFPW